VFLGKLIQREEPDVVSGEFVFRTDVAESGDEKFHVFTSGSKIIKYACLSEHCECTFKYCQVSLFICTCVLFFCFP